MKRFTLFTILTLLLATSVFAGPYETFLAKGKAYETRKQWCYALGSYYDALLTDTDPEEKLEAYEAYKKLADTIRSGKPGYGTFNIFDIHDEWKTLLKDAEKYGSKYCPYEFTIGNIVVDSLNYTNRTASCSAEVSTSYSQRYTMTISVIEEGFKRAYRSDWIDFPSSSMWPAKSFTYAEDEVFDIDGTLIFKETRKPNRYSSVETIYKNVFAAGLQAYGLQINIVDEAGNVLVNGVRYYHTNNRKVVFNSVSASVMEKIEAGKAFANPEFVMVLYGNADFTSNDDSAAVISTLSKKKIAASNVFVNWNGKSYSTVNKRVSECRTAQILKNVKMVSIPGTSIQMLSTEVTQQIYTAVMEANPSYRVGDAWPVENVSWYDAIVFCNKLSISKGLKPVYSLSGESDPSNWDYIPHKEHSMNATVTVDSTANGYRLPTLSEWRNAARAGTNNTYAGGNNLNEVGWYSGNAEYKTHEVGIKNPNEYGLYDMSGNVWEWVYDLNYSERYYCGGSYDEGSSYCQISSCNDAYPNYKSSARGFRIVCSTLQVETDPEEDN